MLELSLGLPADSLSAIVDLEARTLAVDGGRLKLEWPTLRSRDPAAVNDVLWWEETRLVGFLGIYCFDGHNAELVGMVDPAVRRRGIGTKLVDAALALCRDRSYQNVLLVTPHEPDFGRQLAVSRGGTFDHGEYALRLFGGPIGSSGGLNVTVRTAIVDDAALISEILAAAFGFAPSKAEISAGIAKGDQQTCIVEADEKAVGTIRITLDGTSGGVYGFAVTPAMQGRGIGRQALHLMCEDLARRGATQISLEVATQNESALNLYLSLGFEKVTTEDYFSIPVEPQ
jgi:ribosomal protein S18 acetylase RimI-like enzyme